MKVLKTFMKHKTELHELHDPAGLTEISKVFDLRWWQLFLVEQNLDDRTDSTKLWNFIKNHLDKGSKFVPGMDLGPVLSDLKMVAKTWIDTPNMASLAAKENIMKHQWKIVFQHPDLQNLKSLEGAINRLTMAANSEAGCEQSNSKYNRAKNKLSSTMKLPMIKARMRVGSNGPPIHLFNDDPVLNYWKENHHRLAQKTWVQSMEHSVVVHRIQKEEAEKYTSTMFI